MTAARTAKPLTAYGPNQLADRLGLLLWQRDRAIAAGDIPAPDRADGKWSAAVVDELAARAAEIRVRAGTIPDCGAHLAAEHLSCQLGVDITAAGVRHLRDTGRLEVVDSYREHALYDGRVIEAWTDTAALVEAERLGRETERRQDVVDGPAAVAMLDARPVDLSHLVRAGLLRPARHARGRYGTRVPLYRIGDIEDLAASDRVDWVAVRATPKGRPSPLAKLPDAPKGVSR